MNDSFFLKMLLCSSLLTSAKVGAQSEENSQNALRETQRILENPQLRTESIKQLNSTEALKADERVRALGDSRGQTEAIYQLSSQVFETLVTDIKGDPALLEKRLQEAARNPAAFAESLSSDQRKQIKTIGDALSSPPPTRP